MTPVLTPAGIEQASKTYTFQEAKNDMTVLDSTTTERPAKPYPEFPLYAHKTRRWGAKIAGKTHFFGPWRDPFGSLARYMAEKEDLKAGKPRRASLTPPDASNLLTVEQMVILFLEAKKLNVQAGELSTRTWKEYESLGKRLIRVFGAKVAVVSLGPADFRRLRADFQKTHKALTSLKGDLAKSRLFFNWAGPGAHGQHLIDRAPHYGDSFKAPPQRALDREREESVRVFTAQQIRALLDKALDRPAMRAIIFMGINCGFGNTDCSRLVTSKLDLNGGWANFARTKNATRRRDPLWPETVQALREALKIHRRPECAKQVFVTRSGKPFHAYDITHEFEKLAILAGMTQEEADYYDLRRTCLSIGVQCNDDDAVRTIMGHKRHSKDMIGVYNRLQVSDERLLIVSNHIHNWLFPETVKGKAKQVPSASSGPSAAPSETAEQPPAAE